MAIAYSSQGAGVSTETSGAALSPLCPATVNANDILIAHVFWEGTTTAPSTPANWTLLDGPRVIQSTIARHWVFGKIAAGTEDGSAVAFGNPAVTTQRAARIYSFTGWVSGTITDVVTGFADTSHATDPQMPTVTTTVAGAKAVALVAQNDNNAFASPTGESGGDWVEAVAEYTAALTPGLSLGIETCTPTADPGTVSGGSMATTNDPCGVIGFEIRPSVPAVTGTGALASQSSTTSGAGVSSSISTDGAISSQSSAVAGSGVSSSTGTGSLSAQSSTLAGVGEASDSGISGSGVLLAQSASLDGIGITSSVGSGVFLAQASDITAVGISLSSGSGILLDGVVIIQGLGISGSTGTGTLVSGLSAIVGLDAGGITTLFAGETQITGIKLGEQTISKAYVGNSVLFE